MKNETTFSNSFTEPLLSEEELNKAIEILEDGEASKKECEAKLAIMIKYLARTLNYKVFESKFIPKGHIIVGVGNKK